MSDTILRVFPLDPEFVPDEAGVARAVEEARQLFSGRWVEVEAETSDQVLFVDNGENLERVVCPHCEREIDLDWWADRLDEAMQRVDALPAHQLLTVPCCGAEVRMDELRYEWPVGFARFVIDVWNPDPWPEELDPVTQRLAASVGSPMRAIWAYY
jgi:hypothetical protein